MHRLEEVFPLYTRHVLGSQARWIDREKPADVALVYNPGPTDAFWALERDDWSWHRDLGVLAPMFSEVWMEAQTPIPLRRVRSDLPADRISAIEAQRRAERGSSYSPDSTRKVAAMVTLTTPDDVLASAGFAARLPGVLEADVERIRARDEAFVAGAKWIYDITPYAELDRGFTQELHPSVTVAVDPQGNYLRHDAPAPREIERRGEPWIVETLREHAMKGERMDLSQFASDIAFTAMYTLSLANCKNVDLGNESARVESRRTKKELRPEDLAPRSFSTIRLNTPAGAGSEAGGDAHRGRLHFVRGHFKTYTAENKLLGRHVGTYFWQNHARGDQALGDVASSYEL